MKTLDENQTLREKIAELKKREDDRQHDAYGTLVLKYQEEITELKQELEITEHEGDTLIKSLRKEIAELEKQIAKYKMQLEGFERVPYDKGVYDVFDLLKKQKKMLEKFNEKLRRRLNNAEKEIAELKQKLSHYEDLEEDARQYLKIGGSTSEDIED